ncbi:triadin-like isoform X2 [Vanessa atalanta]|uniref:triadin-like isoform X2 n=1 Tax=Vanessa atalanta TaxID=42275 RepID=UPI001FCDEFA2|nr:triadin-like isoform X2 [Vanessa atalanta]
MELLRQVSNTQFLFPAAAVAVVLVCAALVFIFGFHTAEQPQFDKLPLIVDDRKSSNKKRKTKEKSSPNRTSNEDAKSKTESTKKSPAKEKKEDKVKEVEKPKPKEKAETKVVKPAADIKKAKKGKAVSDAEKPADFDEGVWEEVPKKSDKKVSKVSKVKPDDKDKKESPSKKNKKKTKEADVEAAQPAEEPEQPSGTIKVLSAEGPYVDEDAAKALQAQVEELQRVLKEAERRDQIQLGSVEEDDVPENELTEVKDLRSNKKKENKEKQIKKKANEATAVAKNIKPEENENLESSEKQEDKPAGPVFDELGDTWTDAKVAKKSKKKPRKDQ